MAIEPRLPTPATRQPAPVAPVVGAIDEQALAPADPPGLPPDTLASALAAVPDLAERVAALRAYGAASAETELAEDWEALGLRPS